MAFVETRGADETGGVGTGEKACELGAHAGSAGLPRWRQPLRGAASRRLPGDLVDQGAPVMRANLTALGVPLDWGAPNDKDERGIFWENERNRVCMAQGPVGWTCAFRSS